MENNPTDIAIAGGWAPSCGAPIVLQVILSPGQGNPSHLQVNAPNLQGNPPQHQWHPPDLQVNRTPRPVRMVPARVPPPRVVPARFVGRRLSPHVVFPRHKVAMAAARSKAKARPSRGKPRPRPSQRLEPSSETPEIVQDVDGGLLEVIKVEEEHEEVPLEAVKVEEAYEDFEEVLLEEDVGLLSVSCDKTAPKKEMEKCEMQGETFKKHWHHEKETAWHRAEKKKPRKTWDKKVHQKRRGKQSKQGKKKKGNGKRKRKTLFDWWDYDK